MRAWPSHALGLAWPHKSPDATATPAQGGVRPMSAGALAGAGPAPGGGLQGGLARPGSAARVRQQERAFQQQEQLPSRKAASRWWGVA